ncbi:hypothetical protein LCGC14_1749910, partial [marine sediment metagenome]
MSASLKNDADLIKGLVEGERGAFETLYRRHNTSMVRVASAILRNP